MSGYLQRLATSTQKPSPSIHPVIGSFYSGAPRERTRIDGVAAEQPGGEHEQVNIVIRNRIAEPAAPPVVERVREVSRNEQERSEILMPAAGDIRPAIKGNQTPDGSLRDEPPQSTPFKSPTLPPLQNKRPAPADRTLNAVIEQLMESGPTTEASNAIRRQIDPEYTTPEQHGSTLMPESQARTATDFASAVRLLRSAPDIGRKQQLDESQRQPAAQKEPDEIQIHIGRIEVTAVQAPAAVSSPTKPRHPGPSLDEYLQRRGKRTQ